MIVTLDGVVEANAEKVLHSLWAGTEPTADDLVEQMRAPFQYTTERASWEIRKLLLPLGEGLAMLSPHLRRRRDEPPKVSA
jgi:hypothetical protein